MTRSEEAGMNVVLAGEPQVLDQDDWLERLHVARRDIGTSMTSDEVAALSIDAPALSRVTAAGVFGERAGWVLPLWARRPKVWFLTGEFS